MERRPSRDDVAPHDAKVTVRASDYSPLIASLRLHP
jgi:hypothetical protein